MRVQDEGTIVLFIPESDEEHEWLKENTNNEDWQWLGRNLAVDHSMAGDLARGIEADGYTVHG